MKRICLHTEPLAKERLFAVLDANGVRLNEHAVRFLSHPLFSAEDRPGELQLVIASLRELGFERGAALPELFDSLPALGLRPCRPSAGVVLRLAWRDQPRSGNSVLTGQHAAPDGAVTVLSAPLESGDAFPKGLYLRNVDGALWLRGYVCDALHRWSPDDLFALEE